MVNDKYFWFLIIKSNLLIVENNTRNNNLNSNRICNNNAQHYHVNFKLYDHLTLSIEKLRSY